MIYLDEISHILLNGFKTLTKKGTEFVLDSSLEEPCFINPLDQDNLKIELSLGEDNNIEINCEFYFTSRQNPLDSTPISIIGTQSKNEKGFVLDFNQHWDTEIIDEEIEIILQQIMAEYKDNPKLEEFTLK